MLRFSPVKLSLVATQGTFSYTVAVGDDQSKISQFRVADSDLDRTILDLARRIHGQLVPSHTFYGTFYDRPPAYGIDMVSGTPYVNVKLTDLLSNTRLQHHITVEDFARCLCRVPPRALLIPWLGSLQHLGMGGST